MRREAKQIASVLSGIIIVYLAAFAAQIPASLILSGTYPSALENPVVIILLSTLPMYLVGIPLAMISFRFGEPLPPQSRKLSPLIFLGAVALCFALALVGSIMGQVVTNIISAITHQPNVNPVEELTRGVPFWLNLLIVALCAPLAEELIYRKLVIDRLRRYGDIPAVLISALIFGAIHGNFNQFFYATLTGALFGIVYCATGRLRYSIALHMLFNTVGMISGEITGHIDGEITMKALAAHPEVLIWLLFLVMLYLVCFICSPIVIALVAPKLRPARASVIPDARQRLHMTVLNPAFWLFLVLIVYLFL